jgi:rod shape-determining protein MreC
MGNIFTILFRVFPFIAFIFLEVISFYIISKYNDYYKSNIISRSNSVVGGFYKEVSDYENYFNLKDYNESLVKENADLKKQLFNTQLFLTANQVDTGSKTLVSPVGTSYEVMSAKVVSNSISNARNYIIIDKGSKDGVTIDMAAITENGPIGKVIDVSENYCCLMSFINKDMIVGARVKSTQHLGQLKWAGGDVRIAKLDEIPKHIKLKKGDEIVTSGNSNYFPEGILIGRVVEQKEDKLTNFANINVALYNDFTRLKYIYLIKHKDLDEIKKLEENNKSQSANTNEQ